MSTRPVSPATTGTPPGAAADLPEVDVVVVGSANADIVARVAVHPLPGETLLGESMTVLSGGKGANQAVAAARLGSRVAFVGAVGDDSFAEPAQAGLRAAGVDLDALAVVPGSTGFALITVSDDGENTIVVVPGANASVDAERVRTHGDLVARAAIVVVQGEIPRDGLEEAARLAAGRLVVNLAPVVEVDPAVLLRADPLVVNEHEASLVARALAAPSGTAGTAGSVPDGAASPVPDGAPPAGAPEEDVVAWLLDRGVPSVVLTVGARGALVGRPAAAGTEGSARAVVAVPSPRVTAVDTTGAGDAFVGALAHRLAGGADLVEAARFAARVGAYAVRSAGAQASYPDADDALPEVDA